jgi:site-specific DNA-methyltransferase (adenine-specific)
MITPYYADDSVTLYHGDMREVLPALGRRFDCAVVDPPYSRTNGGIALHWDRWPDGWPTLVTNVTSSMWCFGTMRMFHERHNEFDAWSMSHEVVWEKDQATGKRADRFRRIHELAIHWYTGRWTDLYRQPQKTKHEGPPRASRDHRGERAAKHWDYDGRPAQRDIWVDDGTRFLTSVLRVRGMHMRAIHPTEKPVPLLDPLICYACPPGGTVLDTFAGSGSTGEAARLSGRRAVLIEAHEPYCEAIARRMSADVLPLHITGELR